MKTKTGTHRFSSQSVTPVEGLAGWKNCHTLSFKKRLKNFPRHLRRWNFGTSPGVTASEQRYVLAQAKQGFHKNLQLWGVLTSSQSKLWCPGNPTKSSLRGQPNCTHCIAKFRCQQTDRKIQHQWSTPCPVAGNSPLPRIGRGLNI